MDKEMILSQFEEIEQKLEKVVALCKSYEAITIELKKQNYEVRGGAAGEDRSGKELFP